MKRFWINIGIAFTITAFFWIIGQIIAKYRKDYLSPFVSEQKAPISSSFDHETLEDVYNNSKSFLIDKGEL